MNNYESYIALSRYARYDEFLKRRETWEETCRRIVNFWTDRYPKYTAYLLEEALPYLEDREVVGSMRVCMTAGEALEKHNVSGYNCAYIAVDHPRAFDEILYILMCGTGVGFSCERQYVAKLPEINEEFYNSDSVIVVPDSKIGWATSFRELVSLLYSGKIPKWDMSKVRPKGARLKTFGGRACLTGDTLVYKDRKKERGYNEISIKDLFDMKNSKGNWKGVPNHFNKVKLRSLDEDKGVFFRNRVIDVIDNGVAPVYLISTKNGYRIKATDNHRFLRDTGEYDFVSNFSEGDFIAVNGSKERKTGECIDCGCNVSRRAKRCKSCFDVSQLKPDCLGTTARQRKECREKLKDYCERCEIKDTRFVNHHKDENPRNNSEDNLETLCEKCHRIHHFTEWTFGDPYSHRYLSFDEIVSIDYVGTERVYDLVMEGPNHNFIANGFVSHNSGPEPLEDLFRFSCETFKKAKGRKLTSIEVHDIVCKIAEVVVVGGVRRSALISLSNLSDDRMRLAKSGQWWEDNPQRALANNSAVYTERPDIEIFMEEWLSLIKSKSGERGIFSRQASYNKVKSTGKRDPDHEWGTNPCSEIILRSKQFCNLSEVCIRPTDTLEDLKKKVEIATVLGTLQSTLTDFKYLRKDWKKNCEEERLLGVSLTGIMDHPVLSQPGLVIWDGNKKLREEWLQEMKDVAEKTNRIWASYIGISDSTAITCVKPSGTVSQLCDTASGIHPRFSEYYIRRVRQDKKDPLAQFMIEKGFPCEDDVMNPHTYVFSFPMKSPEGSIKVNDVDAISQLETWKVYAEYWCDHKPSITVYVKEDEWLQVGDWVYRNFDKLSGVSFLPYSDHNYRQAPYEAIDEDRYNELLSRMPKDVDFSELVEDVDNTTGSKELACVAGVCEI